MVDYASVLMDLQAQRTALDVELIALDTTIAALDRIASAADKHPVADKNPQAVALGRLGGLKGGRIRADRMTPRERSVSASLAARARWRMAKTGSI